MKKLLIILTAFISLSVQAQFQRPNNSYGTTSNRVNPDSTLFIPTGTGTPSLRSVDMKKMALYGDSVNNLLQLYNPKTKTWGPITGNGYNSATSIDSSSYSLNKTNGDKTVFVFDGETESSIDSTTASNGLTKVVNDVQLGGKLNNNTTIDRNGHYLYLRDSTGAATGLYIISTGTGLQVQSTSTGPGINVFTTGSQAISLNTTYSGTNNIQPILTYYRNSSGTAANGIGGSLDFNIQNASGSGSIVNQIISKLTNASFGTSLQSQFQITGVSNATTNNLLSLNGNGSAQLNKYGAGTFTGTPAKQLSVDATGNIIETTQPIITSGTVAPTSTPAKVGDIYVDITNKKLYFAAGNSSSSDWIIAN